MSEMVEKVAQAIGALMWTEEFPGTDASQRAKFTEAARAAIQAMREPTLAMQNAIADYEVYNYYSFDLPSHIEEGYGTMIDAALKD
jgi:hypothetical protein